MSTALRPTDHRVLEILEHAPSRIPVIVGGSGSGRTRMLHRLEATLGEHASQYLDVERIATTPERFACALARAVPLASSESSASATTAGSPRLAFDAAVALLCGTRRPDGGPMTFLLDEALEVRTFEHFPNLRSVLTDLLAALGESANRFVLTSRFVSRSRALLRDAPDRFVLVAAPPLLEAEVLAALEEGLGPGEPLHADVARAVHALADGRPAYAQAIIDALGAMRRDGEADPVSALASLLAPSGTLAAHCRFTYELRLHRARGYGALKAILDVLAQEEPLTLTAVAQRLHRTPGSTKDYLSWLEDVDLVSCGRKRYSFTDPVLRLWVRLHCRASPPSDADVAYEVQRYAMTRLPAERTLPAASAALAGAGSGRSWGIIEID